MVEPPPMFLDQKKEQPKSLFKQGGKLTAESIAQVTGEVGNVGRRLRILDGWFTNLRRKTQVIEQNMLNHNKKFSTETKAINSDIKEIKKEIIELKDSIIQIVSELKKSAKKEEIQLVKKYVNLWEPVNFVTKNDVKKIIEEVIDEKLNS